MESNCNVCAHGKYREIAMPCQVYQKIIQDEIKAGRPTENRIGCGYFKETGNARGD